MAVGTGNIRVTGTALEPADIGFHIHPGILTGHGLQLCQQLLQNGSMEFKGFVQVFGSLAAQEQLEHTPQVHIEVLGDVLAHHVVHILTNGIRLLLIGQGCHDGHEAAQQIRHLLGLGDRNLTALGTGQVAALLIAGVGAVPVAVNRLLQCLHGLEAFFPGEIAVTAAGRIYQEAADGDFAGLPCQLENQIKEVQTHAAQLRAITEAVTVVNQVNIRHFLGSVNVAAKIAVHMVIATELVQRFQHIAGFPQRAIVGIPVHRLPEGAVGFLTVGPQIQEIHLIRQIIHKPLHHTGHCPDARRRIRPHAPAVIEQACAGNQLMQRLISVLRVIDVDVDEILHPGGNMMLCRGAAHKIAGGAVCLNPNFHEGLDKGLIHGIFRVEAGDGLGGGIVILDPLAAEIAGIGIERPEFQCGFIWNQGNHHLHAQALGILDGIPNHIPACNVLGGDFDAGQPQLDKGLFPGVAVPAVQTVGVNFVAGVFIQLLPPLCLIEKCAVVIHPLTDGVAHFEFRTLLQSQTIRQR